MSDPILLLEVISLGTSFPLPPEPLVDCPRPALCGDRALLPGPGCIPIAGPSVELAWDEVELDADGEPERVAGYRVYLASRSRQYECVHDVGSALEHELSGLLSGVTYYLSVTAYDAAGNESTFSDEICVTPE